jgi:hypothetical protein
MKEVRVKIMKVITKIKWKVLSTKKGYSMIMFVSRLKWKIIVWLEYHRLSLKKLGFKIKKLIMNKLIEPVILRFKIMMLKRKLNNVMI